MATRPVLSLVRFRPPRVVFDDTIRAAVESLVASGARHALAGRTGADPLGERLLASVWADEDPIDDAIEAAIDLTALIDVAGERVQLEIADGGRLQEGRILRLASGTVAEGGLMRYVAAALSGLEDDRSSRSRPYDWMGR